jgi:hypothetical protein
MTIDILDHWRTQPVPWVRYCAKLGVRLQFEEGGYLANPEQSWSDNHDLFRNGQIRRVETLADEQCVVLLGEPGIGKSDVMRQLRGNGRQIDLGAVSEHTLVKELSEFVGQLDHCEGTSILQLDGTDEFTDNIRFVSGRLGDALKNVPAGRVRLRIGCRTAVWPKDLQEVLQNHFGVNGVHVFELIPLQRADVELALQNGLPREIDLDPKSFLDAVEKHAATALASVPLTLGFLVNRFVRQKSISANRAELYHEGCLQLCEYPKRQSEDIEPGQLAAAAMRLAAVALFCRRSAIRHEQRGDLELTEVCIRDVLGRNHEEYWNGTEFDISFNDLKEALRTGLFSAAGPQRFTFRHQSFAEFLAAEFVSARKMSWPQVKSLLLHPEGAGRVVPQLRGVAVWLACYDTELKRHLAEHDPETLLEVEPTSLDVATRKAMTVSYLRMLGAGEISDWRWWGRYERLQGPDLAEILVPYFSASKNNFAVRVRRAVVEIAHDCKVTGVVAPCIERVLDPDEDEQIRIESLRIVRKFGNGDEKKKLVPLALGQISGGRQDRLREDALKMLWPEHITADELFSHLTINPGQMISGSINHFIHGALVESLAPEDICRAMAWIRKQPALDVYYVTHSNVLLPLLKKAWDHRHDERIFDAFVDAVAARLERGEQFFAHTMEESLFQALRSDHTRANQLATRIAERYPEIPQWLYPRFDDCTQRERGDAGKSVELAFPRPGPSEELFVAFLRHAPTLSWRFCQEIVEREYEAGREIIWELAQAMDQDRHLQAPWAALLGEGAVAELYLWLEKYFPEVDDRTAEGDYKQGGHATSTLRSALLNSLTRGTTRAALEAMNRLVETFPANDDLKMRRAEVHGQVLDAEWRGISPHELLALADNPRNRQIQTADQLLDVVMESLARYQLFIRGDYTPVRILWNEREHDADNENKKPRPRSEIFLSDRICQHLNDDLKKSGILVNREVEITPPMSNGIGERIDIRVDAISKGTRSIGERLSVVIEVKGSWNKDLKTAMNDQLRNTYLTAGDCRHGVYLVVYFNPDYWDRDDPRRKTAGVKWSLKERREDFEKQARNLSTNGFAIRAFVLDASLR